MFLQLRRVVCLLILLQCCVCVVNASDAGDINQMIRNLNELARKVDDLKVKAENCKKGLQGRGGVCKESVSTMKSAVDNANKRINEVEEVIPGAKNEKDIQGRAWDAAQKAKDAAEKAKTVVNETEANITYCMREAGNLLRGTYDLEDAIKEYSEMVVKYKNGDKGKYKDQEEASNDVVAFADKVRVALDNAIEEAKDAVREVKDQLESSKKSLEGIDWFLRSVPDRPIPIPAEEQPPSATENRDGSSEKENGQSVVAGQRGTEELQSNTHTNGMTETAKNNTENAQVHQNPEQNVMDNVNTSNGTKITGDVERGDGVQNTNGNPQKPNETSNTASGTVNTGSGGVTSGSNSSTSMNLNVSGLRDGSSSPALVHRPLLLLLLCVLGSILVC